MIESIEPSARAGAEPRGVETVLRTGTVKRPRTADTFRIGPLRFQKNPLSGLALGLALLGWVVIAGLVYLFW